MSLRGKSLALTWVVAVSVMTMAAAFLLYGGQAIAAGNPEISFEGKVVTAAGVNVPDGTYAMEFKIYTGCTNEPTNSTGCSAVWTEDYTGAAQLVTFTSGTFQVNLGSITAFGGSVPWDTSPLYLSMQISNTEGASCAPAGNFTSNCTGDGVMNPFIELTASPYAEDSALLGGLAASAFGQLATANTWTTTNTIQPLTDVAGLVVQQTAAASPSHDIFDVDGATAGNFIQVTSTAANAGTVSISSLGTGNALTLDSGSTGNVNIGINANNKTIQIGATNSAITDTINVGNNTNASGISNVTVGSLDSTSQTTVQAGANGNAAINLSVAAGGGVSVTQANEPSSTIAGVSNAQAFYVNGGDGGATTGSGFAAGNGSSVVITAGNGGNAVAGSTNGNGGSITLSGGSAGAGAGTSGSSGGVIVQDAGNSATAFRIQNAAGQAVFVQGTNLISQTNDVTNYTFTGGTTGWAVEGAATALTQVTNQTDVYPSNYGIDSIDDTLAASGTSGIEIAAAGLAGSSLAGSTTYKFGFYAMGSATITGLTVAFNGTGGTCTPNYTSISSTGFTYFSCTTTPTTATTIVTIESTASASQTLYISDPQITTSSLTNYQLGSYQTNGVDTASEVAYQNTTNSTTAFQVQNASGTTILDVDTLNGNVIIGTNTSTNTTNTSLLQLDSVDTYTETETCSATFNQGSIYFNTSSNTIRACIDGSWTDLASSSALGLLAFGIVSTSGGAGNAGDLAATSTASVSGPCKVSWASANSVTVQPCIAYSGGREVMVGTTVPGYSGAQTVSLTGLTTTDRYSNLCFATNAGAASNTLALVGAGNAASTSLTSATIEPTWNAGAPVLCLATIVNGTSANGSFVTAGMIYDTRTYVETVKTFALSAAAMSLSSAAELNGTAGEVEVPTATGIKLAGTIIASTGAASSGGAPNVIIANSGPGEVQSLSGATVTIGDTVEEDGAAGQTEAANAGVGTAYANLGQAMSTANSGGACTSAATCVGSIFLNIDIGFE